MAERPSLWRRQAVDTVADGIYHLGFAICGERLLNEDGNDNASLADVAFWLSEFLADDLAAGTLANSQVDLSVKRYHRDGTGSTGRHDRGRSRA